MTEQIFLVISYSVFVGFAWYTSSQFEALKNMSQELWLSFVFVLPATFVAWGDFGVPGLLVAPLGVAIIYIVMSILHSGNSQGSGSEQHIRGAVLQDARDHKMLLKKKNEIERKTGRIVTTIGGVPITKADETTNILMAGSPKSGKSQAVHEVIEAVRARNERAIIFDESGDFITKHAADGDLLVNPYDARTVGWSIMNEVRSIEDCANLANAMIPDGTNSTENQWNSYARGIIQAVLEAMFKAKNFKNATLFEIVMIKKVSDLKKLCEGTPAQRAFEEGNERMVSSILTIMANSIAPWRDVPDGKFSIRDYVQNEEKYKGKCLFLASDAGRLKAIAPVYLAMLNLAVVAVNSLPADENRRLWFFLDELPALGALNELDALLNRARKRGGCACIGVQSLQYFTKMFGRESTPILLSGIGINLILRTNDESSAKELAAQLGEQDVLRAVVSESSGSSGSGSSENKSTNYQTAAGVKLVIGSEVMKLADRVGYLKRAGENRAMLIVEVPICYKQGKFPAFVPRKTQEQLDEEERVADDKKQAERRINFDIEEAAEREKEKINLKEFLKDQSLGIGVAVTAAASQMPTPDLNISISDILSFTNSVDDQPRIIGQTVHHDHHKQVTHEVIVERDIDHQSSIDEGNSLGLTYNSSDGEHS